MQITIDFKTTSELMEQVTDLFYLCGDQHLDELNKRLRKRMDLPEPDNSYKFEPMEAPKPKAESKPKAKPKAESKPVSVDDVRRAFREKNSNENRDALKGILSDLGADKITDLAPEAYAVALERLEALS